MADFKIKPASGTGNKLILESQDGTDVLTTSDSGVTITGDITMSTTGKIKQKGSFMQSSTHQAMVLGG